MIVPPRTHSSMIVPARLFYLGVFTVGLLVLAFHEWREFSQSTQQSIEEIRSLFPNNRQPKVSSFEDKVLEAVNSLNKTQDTKTIESDVNKVVKLDSKPHHHTNLYPENLKLINITNLKLIINSDICNISDIALVTIIHTACQNKAARDVIRQTWGTPNIPNVNTRLVFLLGQTDNQDLQKKIINESLEFGDLVQGGFVDTYHNLSYKNLFGKLWVSQFCEQAEFVVKTDDDMFVDLFAVYKVTRPYLKHEFYLNNSFILCPVLNGLPILRDPRNKWYASYHDLPRDTKKYPGNSTEYYPTDCTGWIYIVNPGTAARLAEIGTHPKTLKFFWIDDVWVTGYLARDLNIKHLDMIKFWTMQTERLLLMKSAQNPDIYHRDFISAPQSRNYKISLALHRRAEWCYLHNCWSNIYQPERNVTDEDKINDELLVSMFFNQGKKRRKREAEVHTGKMREVEDNKKEFSIEYQSDANIMRYLNTY